MAAQKAGIISLKEILHSLTALDPELAAGTVLPLHGGDISSVWKISTSHAHYCLKVYSSEHLPHMGEAERKGLEILRSRSHFRIPQVLATGEMHGNAFLCLEFLASGRPDKTFWQNFGMELAHLHSQSAANFGLDHDNFIGSLPQRNTYRENWADFYSHERLLPQTKLARDKGRLSKEECRQMEVLCTQLPHLIPAEAPALLHGDLWSGNYLCTSLSEPALIDPAVYYGHREIDLAMTRLFGGFPEEFYAAYQHAFPLEPGSDARTALFQLYPLLVHLNLFGQAYLHDVQRILARYN